MRDDTPVLIGAGQFAYWGTPQNSPSPLKLLKVAAERAVLDVGAEGLVLADLDALAVATSCIAARGGFSKLSRPHLAEPPAFLARAVCAGPDRVTNLLVRN